MFVGYSQYELTVSFVCQNQVVPPSECCASLCRCAAGNVLLLRFESVVDGVLKVLSATAGHLTKLSPG